MRLTAEEKQEIIHLVIRSNIGIALTLRKIGLNKSTFYKWDRLYSEHGIDGLQPVNELLKGNSLPFNKSEDLSLG